MKREQFAELPQWMKIIIHVKDFFWPTLDMLERRGELAQSWEDEKRLFQSELDASRLADKKHMASMSLNAENVLKNKDL